jgi:2-keto-4-pentenoate hydratase/2-oxohepta-3-ene-1,7-dioic acid hydratase in catechol pathway
MDIAVRNHTTDGTASPLGDQAPELCYKLGAVTRYCRYLRIGGGAAGTIGGGAAWGVLDTDSVTPLAGDPYDGPSPTGQALPLSSVQLLPPCLPSKILGVGTNYRAHAAEMGKPIPDEPLLFMKPPSSLIGHNQPIIRPTGSWRVDFEGELAVVIGRRCRRVRESEALDYVFGFTICNDVTVRDLQKKDGQFTRAKGFDTFCPVGPSLTVGLDPANLRIRTWQNSALKQDSSTSDLIFTVAKVIEIASRVMTLEAGDLITTGTPSGVGPIQPGDRIDIEVEGIGILSNPVMEET